MRGLLFTQNHQQSPTRRWIGSPFVCLAIRAEFRSDNKKATAARFRRGFIGKRLLDHRGLSGGSGSEEAAREADRSVPCIPLLFGAVGRMPSFSASVWHGDLLHSSSIV
jgi:hypothetical protein